MMKSEKAIPLPSWWFRGEMCVWLAVRTKEKRVDGEHTWARGSRSPEGDEDTDTVADEDTDTVDVRGARTARISCQRQRAVPLQ